MSEIVDDLKISNVEITNSLGINMTSDIARIKHTGNNEFNINSNGEITISTENKTNGYDCDINLYAGDGDSDETGGTEGGDIRIYAGDGTFNGSGGDIDIQSGYGLGTGDGGYLSIYAGGCDIGNGGNINIEAGPNFSNAQGGFIEIYSGYSQNGDGGNLGLYGGQGELSGGAVYIQGGYKDGNNANQGAGVFITGGDASGITANGGDVTIAGGYGNNGYGEIRISNGPAQKIGFFGNDPVVRPSETGITAVGFEQNAGTEVRNSSTFTGDLGDKAYTISDIVRALKQLGFLDSYNAAPGVAPAVAPRTVQQKREPQPMRKDKKSKE